jgi:hypothetical protein
VLSKNFANGDLVPLTLPRRDMRRTFYFALPKKRFHSQALGAWMQTFFIAITAVAGRISLLQGKSSESQIIVVPAACAASGLQPSD